MDSSVMITVIVVLAAVALAALIILGPQIKKLRITFFRGHGLDLETHHPKEEPRQGVTLEDVNAGRDVTAQDETQAGVTVRKTQAGRDVRASAKAGTPNDPKNLAPERRPFRGKQ